MDIRNLIQIAKAQGADTLASPTFPFNPPGGVVNPPVQTDDQHAITLATDKTQINTSENFRVRVTLDSQTEELGGFTITISFDPEYLKVLDSDLTVSGVQVDFIDTVYETTVNSANNSTGIITIKAEVPEGEETTLSRTVAEIEFTALKAGTSEVKMIQSSSSLVSTQGTDLLEETNSLNFNISTKTATDTTDGTTQPPGVIPKTGIYDNPAYLSIFIGLLLVVIGIILTRTSSSEKNPRK